MAALKRGEGKTKGVILDRSDRSWVARLPTCDTAAKRPDAYFAFFFFFVGRIFFALPFLAGVLLADFSCVGLDRTDFSVLFFVGSLTGCAVFSSTGAVAGSPGADCAAFVSWLARAASAFRRASADAKRASRKARIWSRRSEGCLLT
jgi:hypothetical protein